MIKDIISYQKESLSFILKAIGIPEEDYHGDFVDKSRKAEQEKEEPCYFCDRPATTIGRVIESPKDTGFSVPMCEGCEEKSSNQGD